MRLKFNFNIVVLFCLASISYAGDTKPKYGPTATRLFEDHLYLKTSNAPDYWALSPYYASQRDPSSCILASFTMGLNALRSGTKLNAADALVTQDALFAKIKEEIPAKRMWIDKGKTITLDEMAELFKKSAIAYKISLEKVEVVHVDKIDGETRQKIKSRLRENEKSAKNLIIANFLQSEFTGDPEGAVGHVAPVAAYDEKTDRVLILDPDREYYEPYWVGFETFLKGLATLDKDAGRNRGILFIELKK